MKYVPGIDEVGMKYINLHQIIPMEHPDRLAVASEEW